MRNHPIEDLIRVARTEFMGTVAKQSQTIADAVQTYRMRTGMHPPPKFDAWFSFAQKNHVQMIDEYDTIQHLLLPFWGLSPHTIRQSVRDAFGAENNYLMSIQIRNGEVRHRSHDDWSLAAVAEMIRKFVHHLPDMDLLFNVHDEPSVVIPNDMLNHLVSSARLAQHDSPHNMFSGRPIDLVDEIPGHYGTNVLRIGRQTLWQQLVASCPVSSPVRMGGSDFTESYAREPLGFIYNTTAFSDVCNQPSLPYHHGFFDRPNSMQYISTLVPIFSPGKVSTFGDILFPSPWYYDQRTRLDDNRDMDWDSKRNQMHWRGSTTSGFPANGGWRRHHRQRFVKALDNIENPVDVLRKEENVWVKDIMSPSAAQSLFDVKFTIVSDMSTPEDHEAQREEFDIAPLEDQQDLWKWKHLLDVDGHGLSGRFYPMLKSRSLVYKCAMFREWHDEWLRPWVHYVPLGLEGTDWFEVVRYFALEAEGQQEAKRMAQESRDWSRKVLRREDMEAWLFRLLLEYFPLCPF